ncbi:MAG TPA: hypothetical protein DCO79_07560 [Spirochaeta sp.]|nr:hypothetical protein [Spirochaeta sp.]
MFRKSIIAVIFLLLGSLLWGQTFDNLQLLRRAGLDEGEIDKLIELNGAYDLVKREAVVEQNFYKAQLERLLLKTDPDMDEVEEVLKNSLEWKLKETMADISRRVEIRKIIGEEKWVRLIRAISEIRQRNAESQ